jgi:uridine kinase
MTAIATPQLVHAPLFSEDNFSIDQRRRLSEFSRKFAEYLPAFDTAVIIQHLIFLKATQKVFSSIEEPFYRKDQIGRKCATPSTRVFLTKALT